MHGASYTVNVDGQTGNSSSTASNPNAGILAELGGMSSGKHEILITVTSVEPNGQLDFAKVEFDAGLRRYVCLGTVETRHALKSADLQHSDRQHVKQNVGQTYGQVGSNWTFKWMKHQKMQFRDENGNDTKDAQEAMLGERRGSRARFNFTGEPMSYL